MPRTPHELARYARIGLRDADAQLVLHLGHGLLDGAAHQLDVLDAARTHPLDRTLGQRRDVEQPRLVVPADGHGRFRRAEVYGYCITLLFHSSCRTCVRPPPHARTARCSRCSAARGPPPERRSPTS